MNNIKVSIILPVYNAQKYIGRTIDSLIKQTLKDIEIICINDGSSDNSLNILKEYKEKYFQNNIVIIDKQNEGVWKARADGIQKACGKYICFVDSDDYVDNSFCEKMYNKIEKDKSDITVCGFCRIDENTGNVVSKEMALSNNDYIEMDKNPEGVISINTSLWNKIYKSSILKSIEEFKNPPRVLEDTIFLSLLYLNIKKISFLNEYLYNYMVVAGSAMNVVKDDDLNRLHIAMLELKDIYLKNNVSKEKIEILDSIAFLHLGISFMLRIYQCDNKNYKIMYNENLEFLNKNFSTWKTSKYLRIFYNLGKKFSNIKVAIVRKIYILKMFRVFLYVYNFITRKLNIDIKW